MGLAMNFTVTLSKNRDYFFIETSDKTSADDIEKFLTDIFSDSSWKNGMHLLFDNRKENLSELSNIEVEIIAGKFLQFNEYLKNSKIALVMPKDLSYGIARMWETYVSLNNASFETQVFRSVKNAREWIENN